MGRQGRDEQIRKKEKKGKQAQEGGVDQGHTQSSWQPHIPSKGSSALRVDPLSQEEKVPKEGSPCCSQSLQPIP